ncbi:dienelactone hydrolase family protein [Roseomonas sp. CAU 1739]|uniref:dienelactone hydrolase family protein n=1 Tax=Roseomonas sp. CAU 1739 TaxID=3140364 RepID=UPI00325BC22B
MRDAYPFGRGAMAVWFDRQWRLVAMICAAREAKRTIAGAVIAAALAIMLLPGHGLADAGPGSRQEPSAGPTGEVVAFERHGVQGILTMPAASIGPAMGIVLVLHDALAPDPRSEPYVDQLLDARIAVLDIRHENGRSEAGIDVFAQIVEELKSHHRAVGVLGFGTGARFAARLQAPLVARALLYPGCRTLAVADVPPTAPVLLMHGAEDDANPALDCTAVASRLSRAGMAVRHTVFAHAGYAWDQPSYGLEQRQLVPRPDGPGRVVARPWPELTALAATQVASFFSASFRTPR